MLVKNEDIWEDIEIKEKLEEENSYIFSNISKDSSTKKIKNSEKCKKKEKLTQNISKKVQ